MPLAMLLCMTMLSGQGWIGTLVGRWWRYGWDVSNRKVYSTPRKFFHYIFKRGRWHGWWIYSSRLGWWVPNNINIHSIMPSLLSSNLLYSLLTGNSHFVESGFLLKSHWRLMVLLLAERVIFTMPTIHKVICLVLLILLVGEAMGPVLVPHKVLLVSTLM